MISKDPTLVKLEQKTQAVTTLLLLVLVILLIQLWLLTAATEAYLAASTLLAVPAFLGSGFCLLVNLGLLRYLYDLDRESK